MHEEKCIKFVLAARTKFQLSHIDDVGGGEGADLCVFTQRIAPTCALHCSAVQTYVREKLKLDKSCNLYNIGECWSFFLQID